MSDTPRTIPVIAIALAASAAELGELLSVSDSQVVPVNVHTLAGHVSAIAEAAAEFASAVAGAPASGVDQALTDRVTHIELLLSEAGLSPTAPAPATAPAAPAPAPAPVDAPAPAPTPAA